MEDKRNIYCLSITFLLIILKPAYECILFLMDMVGLSVVLRMHDLYMAVIVFFCFITVRFKLPLKNLVTVLLVLVFYGISFLWTNEDARQFFYSSDVSAILLVVIPVSFICTARTYEWKRFFNKRVFLITVDLILLISLVFKLNNYSFSDYMSFSYNLLPLWGICLISAFYYKHRWQWLFFAIGVYGGIVYGARGPILWLLILTMFLWIIIAVDDINKRKLSNFLPLLLLAVTVVVLIQYVLPMIINTDFSNTSYVLRRLRRNSFFEDNSRAYIYEECKRTISNMGLSIPGLFYDRTVLPGGKYAHSFFYEILITFGWVLGIPIILLLLYFIIKTISEQNNEGLVFAVFFCCTFFFRYFISGSIFDEPQFWEFLAMMYSLHSVYSTTRKRTIIEEWSP